MCITLTKKEIDKYCENKLENKTKNKTAIILVGGSGSGKTTIKNNTIERVYDKKANSVIIDPDIILSELYNNDNECRGHANKINDILFEKAESGKYDIIFDGTGKDFEWYYNKLIKKLRKKLYTIYISIVTIDINIAIDRIKKRYDETGRNVPLSFIKDVYKKLEKAIPKYINIECNDVDGIFLYDNTKETQLLFSSHCKGDKKIVNCLIKCNQNIFLKKFCKC